MKFNKLAVGVFMISLVLFASLFLTDILRVFDSHYPGVMSLIILLLGLLAIVAAIVAIVRKEQGILLSIASLLLCFFLFAQFFTWIRS